MKICKGIFSSILCLGLFREMLSFFCKRAPNLHISMVSNCFEEGNSGIFYIKFMIVQSLGQEL